MCAGCQKLMTEVLEIKLKLRGMQKSHKKAKTSNTSEIQDLAKNIGPYQRNQSSLFITDGSQELT